MGMGLDVYQHVSLVAQLPFKGRDGMGMGGCMINGIFNPSR